MGLQFCRSYNQ